MFQKHYFAKLFAAKVLPYGIMIILIIMIITLTIINHNTKFLLSLILSSVTCTHTHTHTYTHTHTLTLRFVKFLKRLMQVTQLVSEYIVMLFHPYGIGIIFTMQSIDFIRKTSSTTNVFIRI